MSYSSGRFFLRASVPLFYSSLSIFLKRLYLLDRHFYLWDNKQPRSERLYAVERMCSHHTIEIIGYNKLGILVVPGCFKESSVGFLIQRFGVKNGVSMLFAPIHRISLTSSCRVVRFSFYSLLQRNGNGVQSKLRMLEEKSKNVMLVQKNPSSTNPLVTLLNYATTQIQSQQTFRLAHSLRQQGGTLTENAHFQALESLHCQRSYLLNHNPSQGVSSFVRYCPMRHHKKYMSW